MDVLNGSHERMLREQCLFLQSVCCLYLALTLTMLSHQTDQLYNTEETYSLFFWWVSLLPGWWLGWHWGDLACSR